MVITPDIVLAISSEKPLMSQLAKLTGKPNVSGWDITVLERTPSMEIIKVEGCKLNIGVQLHTASSEEQPLYNICGLSKEQYSWLEMSLEAMRSLSNEEGREEANEADKALQLFVANNTIITNPINA